jgi:hypothetical protein
MLPTDFPALPGPKRDAVILDHVRQGDYEVDWATVMSDISGHHGEFRVFADALKIGGVRITMSAFLKQTVADTIGCSLLTAKLLDLMYAQRAVTLTPHTQTPDASMVTTKVMVDQSEWIDGQVAAASPTQGIVQTVGKVWIVDNLFATNPATSGRAINYGMHFLTPTFLGHTWSPSVTLPGVNVVQGRGWVHGIQEVDYSQNCLLVARTCFVDGVSRDLWDIVQDPTLAPLATPGTPLKVLRQPGVPQAPFVGRTPPCVGPSCPQNVVWQPGEEGPARPRPAAVAAGAIALAATVGGFLGGLALMGPRRRRVDGRPRVRDARGHGRRSAHG